MGFTTDNYDKDESLIKELEELDNSEEDRMPWQLTKIEIWENYTNKLLYTLDKKVRQFLDETRAGRRYWKGQTVIVSELFRWIFNRPAEDKDSKACRYLHELMRYYAEERTGSTTYKGKRIPSGVYKLTADSGNRQPYSIKLRMEEQGGKAKTFSLNQKNPRRWSLPEKQQKQKPKTEKEKAEKRAKYKRNKDGKSRVQRKKEWEESTYEHRD